MDTGENGPLGTDKHNPIHDPQTESSSGLFSTDCGHFFV